MPRGAATEMATDWVSETGGVEESVTLTVKTYVPVAAVVVPVTVPLLARLRPVGSAPPKKLNVNGAEPVNTVMVWPYATPGFASGRLGSTVTGWITPNVYDCVAVRGGVLLSVTWTVKLVALIAVPVPVRSPDGLRAKPVGNVPEVMIQVRLPTPPTC